MAEPEPPVDVHLRSRDGQRRSLDCAFTHYDEDGIAHWRVLTEPFDATVWLLGVGELPGRTALDVDFILPPES